MFLVSMLAACTGNDDAEPILGEGSGCDPLVPEVCALPWPSSLYEAEDPLYLKGKYTGQDVVQPADAPYAKDECKEQQFVNYSKQQ